MFDTIRQKWQDYYQGLPTDIFPKVAKSALFSFVVSVIILNRRQAGQPWNLTQPLMNGAIASLASFIYALTTPFFNALFGSNRLVVHREIMKNLVVITITSALATLVTTSKVNLAAFKFFPFIPINLFLSAFDIIPTTLDWISPKDMGPGCRALYRWMGINAEPGSSSTYITF